MSTFLIFKLVGSLWQCSSKKQRSFSIFQTEETEYRDWLYISGNVEKQNETLSTDHLQIRSYRKTSCCMQTFSFFDISIVHISKIFFRWFRQVLYFLTLHFYKCFPSDQINSVQILILHIRYWFYVFISTPHLKKPSLTFTMRSTCLIQQICLKWTNKVWRFRWN